MSTAMSGLSFQLQTGVRRRPVNVDSQEISLRDLREEALKFIRETASSLPSFLFFFSASRFDKLRVDECEGMKEELQYPEHGLGESLGDHLLLYKHDLRSINILQLVTNSGDVTEGTLVEVVLSCEFFLLLNRHENVFFLKTPPPGNLKCCSECQREGEGTRGCEEDENFSLMEVVCDGRKSSGFKGSSRISGRFHSRTWVHLE